ncbi:antiterminator [Cronobacter sakazakii]|uniref:anti-termination protein Q-like n=1 Tax=Cronobacter phage phiES15 TaxID=1168280 RepID=UPI00025F67C7|nr:bacteriophage antitermination protein Q [Cronobacter sakazakii]YP_006590025.1 anti-termination protein Q-like [Cronobacter phage phiES15]NHW51717.1 antiterminator [Cronobacter sp. HA18003]AFH14942.1 putative antitermination protein Q [Cronobacter phage phiES15]AFJ98451.1 putative phage antitermination protein Q [Cronobacter sakazakii ES15]EJT7705359.1 antiterminator [Cronobacter sakazakii]ELY2518340.1 antiterminator [Cronobacter sakazakii]
MRAQAYEFIRQELIMATADLSGSTKGQLVAFAENAQLITNRYKRKPLKVTDPETGELVAVWNEPVPGVQSRAKGSHIPLVLPVEYATASWRRALLALEPHETAWLMWCYADATRYAHQVEIVRWGWEAFSDQLAGKRIAAKTLARLRALVWLAAQDVKRELRGGIGGGKTYQQIELAALTGVTAKNWWKSYAMHWEAMRAVFERLDQSALINVNAVRKKQKRANSMPMLEKVDF